MNKTTAASTISMILAATAAALTLVVALAPAWVPAQAHDGLRVVELPRVVVTAQREQAAITPVVELPRVVVVAKRESLPASGVLGAAKATHLARTQAQPVLSPQPD